MSGGGEGEGGGERGGRAGGGGDGDGGGGEGEGGGGEGEGGDGDGGGEGTGDGGGGAAGGQIVSAMVCALAERWEGSASTHALAAFSTRVTPLTRASMLEELNVRQPWPSHEPAAEMSTDSNGTFALHPAPRKKSTWRSGSRPCRTGMHSLLHASPSQASSHSVANSRRSPQPTPSIVAPRRLRAAAALSVRYEARTERPLASGGTTQQAPAPCLAHDVSDGRPRAMVTTNLRELGR